MLLVVGGLSREVLPDPSGVDAALERIPLRVHFDLTLAPQVLDDPADTLVVLPATTRYEVPGGVTETSTERRVIFSPEIPGPRVSEARPEGFVLGEIAARVRPELAEAVRFDSTAAVRAEIARVIPAYAGIERLAARGDAFQYGGPHLCAGGTFPLPGGRARFGRAVWDEPERPATEAFVLVTRRGKQFNSMVHQDRDPLGGLRRDAVLLAAADAGELGLASGDPVIVENRFGHFRGRVALGPLARGAVQVHWPEANVLLDPASRSEHAQTPAYKHGHVTVRPVVEDRPATTARAPGS
jgi:anaerobic selenocysteine-containing dehydrogenase